MPVTYLEEGVLIGGATKRLTPCTAGGCLGMDVLDCQRVAFNCTLSKAAAIVVPVQAAMDMLRDIADPDQGDPMDGLRKFRPNGINFTPEGDGYRFWYKDQSFCLSGPEIADLVANPHKLLRRLDELPQYAGPSHPEVALTA